MDPQQAHYQFRWLKVFRAHLDLSIYDLLSAICYLLSAAINGRDELQLVRISSSRCSGEPRTSRNSSLPSAAIPTGPIGYGLSAIAPNLITVPGVPGVYL
jgi:hypothetical protein